MQRKFKTAMKTAQLKIRLRRLKYAPCTTKNIQPKKRSKVDSAINGKYTLRSIPLEIREIMIERVCLKLELKILSAVHLNNRHNSIAIQMADKLRRIEHIDHILKGR